MNKKSYIRPILLSINFSSLPMKSFLRFRNLLFLGAVILSASIWIVSCRHTTEDLSIYPKICFDSQVLPIFQNSCAMSGCHTGGENRYDFRTTKGILDAVVPGSPSKSAAYKSITAIWGESAMPPQQPISEDNRILIRLWIEQGADTNPCSDTTGGGGGDTVSYYNTRACFQRDIFPVILSNCAMSPCHDGKSTHEGELLIGLTTYPLILRIVTPKYPNSSKLYNVIHGGGEDPMPPGKPLSIAQVDSIYKWILYGALNEYCGNSCDTSATATYSGIVWPIIQKNCTGCHSGTNAQKGFHLENYNDVVAAVNNGKLVGALKGQSPYSLMPPGNSLSSCNIYLIEKWIKNKMPNN